MPDDLKPANDSGDVLCHRCSTVIVTDDGHESALLPATVAEETEEGPLGIILPPEAITVGVGIISAGSIAALCYFMQLCFMHPAEAERLMPLIVGGTPVLTLIFQFIGARKRGMKR